MSTLADLRIASKRAHYDNNKPHGEFETITLYVYNAGPDLASAPVVKAGHTNSTNHTAVTTTLRKVQGLVGRQPSKDIHQSLDWNDLPSPTSQHEGLHMITTLPDMPDGVLMELSLTFRMFNDTSYDHDTTAASVASATYDPYEKNNSTTYIITPHHHNDGPHYWNTPGDLSNLDFVELTA